MSEEIDRSRIHRRDLLSGAASLAALAAVAPSTAFARASRATLAHEANDPLGVRPDFPILENGRTYLNAAYIAPCPRSVPAAGVQFLTQYVQSGLKGQIPLYTAFTIDETTLPRQGFG